MKEDGGKEQAVGQPWPSLSGDQNNRISAHVAKSGSLKFVFRVPARTILPVGAKYGVLRRILSFSSKVQDRYHCRCGNPSSIPNQPERPRLAPKNEVNGINLGLRNPLLAVKDATLNIDICL